jgi:integrase
MSEPKRAKRARARYVYRWWESEVRRKASFDRKADRDAFRDELRRRQQSHGLVSLERDVTLDALVEDFWRLHAVPNLEASTRAAYAQQWGKWIQPRLGGYQLPPITPRVVHHQLLDEMRRAGAGEPTVRYALAVLQSILRFAATEGRIDSNPAAAVTKPPAHRSRQVAPVPPETVERLRGLLGHRDATIVSVLAYAGLRPQEALALDMADVTDRKLLVRRKNVDGRLLPYTKTRRDRAVDLLAPLALDLAEWRMASGIREGLLFPTPSGEPWRKHDWDNWRVRTFRPSAQRVGLASAVPYDLRGSFVSLLAWEGRTMLDVARQAGHSVEICDRHYAGIFETLDPSERTSAEAAIRAAREPGLRGAFPLFEDGSG